MKNKVLNFNYNVDIEESGFIDSEFIIAGTAINATTTSNNHKFLPEVLEESAKTLIGCPLLVDHENKVENIKGRVFYASYDGDNKRVPFKAKVMDNTIKAMIKDGRLNSVSVGAMCDPKDIEEGVNGELIPKNIIFKELSLVAVPADQGATFGIAMNQAYKAFKEEKFSDDEIEPEEELDEPIDEKMSDEEKRKMMKKKGMSDEEIEKAMKKKDMSDAQIKSDSSITERRGNMEEQKKEIVEEVKIVEEKSEIKSLNEKIESMNKEMDSLKAKIQEQTKLKEEVVKEEVKEEPIEDSDSEEVSESYKLVQGSGSLKGSSFSVIRNKY